MGRQPAARGTQKMRTTAQAAERAQKVLKLFNDGLSFKQIAEQLGIGHRTARSDYEKALQKLGKTGFRQYLSTRGEGGDPDETVQQYAYEQAVLGRNYSQIGDELGVHRKTAWRLIEREITTRTLPLVAHARLLEIDRIDHALDKVMGIMGQSDSETVLKAVDRFVRLSQRRSELLGLDMPAKLEIHEVSDTDLAIRDMVNSARAKMAADEERRRQAEAQPAAPE